MNPEEKEDEGTGINEDKALAESLRIADYVHRREQWQFKYVQEEGSQRGLIV
jgi:hypothetical protein